jgi:VWFA-related protein
LEPQDRVALYLLSNGVKILHDFTQDQDRLMRMVAQLRGEVSHAVAVDVELDTDVDNPTGSQASALMMNELEHVRAFFQTDRVRATAQGLEAIGNHLARVPGRKNLVWISAGFPFAIGGDGSDLLSERRTFNPEVERASRALNNANVAIYPVDARGLIGDPGSRINPAARKPFGSRTGPGIPNSVPTGLDTMQALADRTGGKAFYNSGDILGAIRKAIEDSEITYTLGFYPASSDLDEKYHELKVKVDRKGVDVRHRKGYFASDSKPRDEQEMELILRDVAASGLEASAIGLAGRLNRLDKPQAGTLQLVANIDASSLNLHHQQDHWDGRVQLVVIQEGSGGLSLDSTSETLNLALTEENYQKVLKGGLILSKGVIPKEGLRNIKVVVQDRSNGAVGSLLLPVPK